MNAARRYAQTQNETASPERLMVLLFATALRHMRVAITELEQGKLRAAAPLLLKASDIVVELSATLDRSRAPELCEQLGELYAFVALRLTRASFSGDVKLVREAERVFAPVVDAFETAVHTSSQQSGAHP